MSLHAFCWSFVLIQVSYAANIFTIDTTGVVTEQKENVLYYPKQKQLAKATIQRTYQQIGWDVLQIESNGEFSDEQQAYAAGYLEGHLHSDMIDNHWFNSELDYCRKPYTGYCKKLHTYLEDNFDWMMSNIRAHSKVSSFWHHTNLQLLQIQGIEDAWKKKKYAFTPFLKIIDLFGLYFLQLGGDMEDLDSALKAPPQFRRKKVVGSGSCSAMIRLLPDFSELFSAQDTWSTYQSMTRVLKKYSFHFRMTSDIQSALIPAGNQTFSSYPACISSGDDFYILNNGLVTMETTNGNSNTKLWPIVASGARSSVFEFLRVQVANRLATDGKSWVDSLTKFNSGTYNNQWMIIDYNKFEKGKSPTKDLLWIAEQIPGNVYSMDATQELVKSGYWGSYNIPAIPAVYNVTGYPEQAKKYGDWFTHDGTPRARIFRRDAPSVLDMKSAILLMRSNHFRTDPLSRCNCTPPYSAENAISARCDLNPANGSYPFGALGHRSHGGIDVKITDSSLMPSLNFLVQGGPTWDDQPAFSWLTAKFSGHTPHRGQPELWKFPVLRTNFTA